MPTVSYVFNTEYGHDDVERLKTFQNAEKYQRSLYEISRLLREKCKYGDGKPTPSWETLRSLFYRMLNDNDLTGEDL
jgi:hypothetical protein